jgi:hypothetical protein
MKVGVMIAVRRTRLRRDGWIITERESATKALRDGMDETQDNGRKSPTLQISQQMSKHNTSTGRQRV